MSIRYTLRHNVPSALIQAENDKYTEVQEGVSDSSIFDFNLMRKHELAETDDDRVVYRQRDGQIVDWTEAATTQAENIRDECAGILENIDDYMQEKKDEIVSIVAVAQEQQETVSGLVDEVYGLIDITAITDNEISTLVGGGS